MAINFKKDIDPIETSEWIDSMMSVIENDGISRANYLFNKIYKLLHLKNNKKIDFLCKKNEKIYINTIPNKDEPKYPGNIFLEEKICSAVRWNAIMMVLRASKKNIDLGGHISSFQSSYLIYEVCFQHFFRASNDFDGGDFVYFQGHISPGIYSRAFLEGRLKEFQIDNFRQEIGGLGLSSYPHPKLMPYFWQFPTVSMGLGAISAIYQAKFLKYLYNRGLKDTTNQTVYSFLGDGEMDEPESLGALSVASRENLNNLIFVINCNLQRLDGPVRGNGNIINELENIFLGSGWCVIKLIWGNKWDVLLKKDITGHLKKLMSETLDGDYLNFKLKSGDYIRKNFFGKYPETRDLVSSLTDDEIKQLNYGGYDSKKIYAAFLKAKKEKNKPVVILIRTVKGFGMGDLVEGQNIAHQTKYIDIPTLNLISKELKIHMSDFDLKKLSYIKFLPGSLEFNYLHNQRKKLKGYIPKRLPYFSKKINLPELNDFNVILKEKNKNSSTTIFFLRILNILLNKTCIKKIIVPIVSDEARTFGMEGLFRKIGIYNHLGQKYIPSDKNNLFYYKEDKKGQMLQEGINESGAFSSWLAAATSYSSNNFPMIPFYIYYSMFGFQRIGDLLWLSADQQARGFLIGATSGRTTLNGEGLQHSDGHSHICSLTIPNCISYDPSYGYELSVIINDGLKRMYGKKQENIFYYITTVNESYCMPEFRESFVEGIIKGIYKLESRKSLKANIQLLGSGSILECVRKASKILLSDYNIGSDVYSVTSFTELARNGQDCFRWNLLNSSKIKKNPYVYSVLNNSPVVASTDYMKIFAEQIRSYIPSKIYYVLGTDGFGRSDSRKNLRNFFEIDESYIIIASIKALVENNDISFNVLSHALKKYNISQDKINPRL